MIKYVLTRDLVNTYHLLDIHLLAKLVLQHNMWKTKDKFIEEKIDLSNTLSKELIKVGNLGTTESSRTAYV